jgi:hypothetical protein
MEAKRLVFNGAMKTAGESGDEALDDTAPGAEALVIFALP